MDATTNTSLYLISPPHIELPVFLPQLDAALGAGGVKAFQLRLKEANDDTVIAAAEAMLPLCRKYDVAFIMNDRADLAVKCQMDGVHLGQEDMSVKEARAIVGEARVIGSTCHASRDLAIDAGSAGADYVAFGAFYPTTSKPMEKIEKWGIPKREILTWWSELSILPCVAIGGVTADNCAPLVQAGADFIAVINAVWAHPQGAAAGVQALNAALKQAHLLPATNYNS